MKKLFALLISLLLILLLTACNISILGGQTNQTPDDPNGTHTHSGGTATCKDKAICADCGESYGSYDENNHISSEFVYAINPDDATKHNKLYSCCGLVESTSVHSGGTATCKDKAICSDCGESYGSLDENNHISSEFTYAVNSADATKHDKIHSCCGLVESTSDHSGGTATCKDKAVCSDCGESYGSLDENNHVSSDFVYAINPDDEAKHDKLYSCCGLVESTSVHSGGAATLSERAICEICNEKYGDFATPGLDYTLSEDGTYYIVSGIGNCASTDIVIPAIYEDLPVKEIQLSAFAYCNITSVVIPEGVTSIGPRAFEHCYDLASVTIPNSVTGINEYTFNACKSLSYINIGNGVTYIGSEAFTSCIVLNNITLPESLEHIGSKAFSCCYRLTSITIPAKVEHIGANAFFTCPRLVEVINHSYINVKADSAFEIHNGDTSKIDNKDGYLFYTYKGTNYLISYIGRDTELTLPDDYKGEEYVIHNQAFYGIRNVTSITISDGVKSIGQAAFAYCRELVSITISGNVESIGNSAIRYCDNFTDVYYTGTEEEWATISIGSYNDTLTGATIHYNYVPEE